MSKKTVITYGTFDMLHEGHLNLLKKAKSLGNNLIVAVTGENYDRCRGKLNVKQSVHDRIKNIERTNLADKIIIEETEGQKATDIQNYNVDLFVIGSDWQGKFDYLKEYCEVLYIARTRGVSSTMLRQENDLQRVGIVGLGNIADRFAREVNFVSNVELSSCYSTRKKAAESFANEHEIHFHTDCFEDFLNEIDAVYIATPHDSHFQYVKKSLSSGKHVLCEKPMCLSHKESREVFGIAKDHNLVLMEAIKTAFCEGFQKIISFAKSGEIGRILQLDASFTKIIKDQNRREFLKQKSGGAHNELMSYPLLAAAKILGHNPLDYHNIRFYKDHEVDIFSNLQLRYQNTIANLSCGIMAKKEGSLVVTGTEGYVYVPAPWWKTSQIHIKFENQEVNKKLHFPFQGDGLRYEISEFINCINKNKSTSYMCSEQDSLFLAEMMDIDYSIIQV